MSDILTGFNMQGNDPIDDRIVSKSNLETLEQYLNRVLVQKRYYGLTFFALDKNNELRKYTFQTSLIEPTIDDNEEEIERIDKELQEHVSNKAIHKTSEEIRSEIVDADIPDTIARVQWTLDQINTAVINLIGGASDEYNTLKRIQTKIEELRAEMESQLYGDDGGTVLKTLEQALKFLNQYKDFIVDIPDNFVSKQDIVDNLTTDDPTKVLSAKQGKILSDTLTNYFESAMQSIRTETDRAINAENRIETKLDKEIDRSIKEDQRIDAKLDAEIERSTDEDIRIDNKLDSEINRSTAEDDRLDKKIDAETTRATTAESNLNTKIETETDRAESEESRIETKLDNEIARSTNKDTEHDNRLTALEGDTHEQNTDLGTTNSTFQLKYNTGNKIKHESDAISVRNAADTDYVNFIAKNATFKGDLLVEGQSFVTEAETVEIKDNLLLLNKGEVGAGVTKGIAGLEIDRGTEPNYQIIFDESDNRFKAGEIGDIQCLALRDGDDSMVNRMFTTWDSTTKRLKTTNIVPSSSFLYFGENKTVSLNYSPADDGSLTINTNNQYLAIFTGDNYTNFRSTRNKFQFIGDLYTTGTKYALTFKRASDNSEVLYHADIVNNLTSGGVNKVLSAEQGKLLNNAIEDIRGTYLPLTGGTMSGSIRFPVGLGIVCEDVSGSAAYGVLRTWNYNGSTRMYVGTVNFPTYISSTASDLIHDRNGSSYLLWDTYNLSDPVTLSGNNTFTGNNTFQAGKFNVGPFRVTSSGSLLSNISSPAGSAWSRSLVFRANSDIPSSLVFGGYNSIDDTSAGYVYIGIGDINYQTAQYKLYSGRLEVPNIWALKAGNYNVLNINTGNNYIGLGSASLVPYIVSSNSDLRHRRFSETDTYKDYIIWDTYNLPTPASTTDLTNYLPLTGGTLTGQVTIKQSVDIKLRLQSTNADNYCIIQAINAQASQLGVFGYAGDKWAIGHGGTYYEIWDKYNLSDPLKKSEAVTLYYPYNGRGYLTINSSGRPIMSNNQGYAVTDKDRNAREVLWMGTDNVLNLGNTSQYTLNQLNLRCTTLTHNGNPIATQNYVTNQLANYLPLSGGTLTGALTMNSRRHNIVVDVVGGAGNTWDEGAGALSVQVPSDSGQTPLLLARRSGATINTTTLSERLLDMALLDTGTIFKVGMSGVNALELEVTSFTNKVGIGKLFGKAIATQEYVNNRSVSWSNITGKPSTYTPSAHSHNSLQIEDNRDVTMLPNNMGPTTLRTFFNANNMPTSDWYSGIHISGWVTNYTAWELCGPSSNNTTTASSLYFRSGKDSTWNSWKKIAFTSDIPTIPSISISNSGSGNAVTSITASGHTLTVAKGATYLTSSSLDGYATQTWSNSQYPLKTGTGASGTWDINISGNASTASAASKLGSTTIGGSAKPIYLSSGTPTACSATVGSATVPVYMNAGTITQCSTTLGVSITGNAATATNSTQLGGTAASSYVKANDNISRLTNDRNYVRSTSTLKVSDIQVLDGGTPGSEAGILYIVLE